MQILVDIYTCIHVSLHMYIHISGNACISLNIYVSKIHVDTYMYFMYHICVYIRIIIQMQRHVDMYIYTCLFIYIYTYVEMHVNMYIYIRI